MVIAVEGCGATEASQCTPVHDMMLVGVRRVSGAQCSCSFCRGNRGLGLPTVIAAVELESRQLDCEIHAQKLNGQREVHSAGRQRLQRCQNAVPGERHCMHQLNAGSVELVTTDMLDSNPNLCQIQEPPRSQRSEA